MILLGRVWICVYGCVCIKAFVCFAEVLWVAKVSKTTSYWENHSIVVYSLNLFKYLGLFLFAALTAQSGGKAKRFHRARRARVASRAKPFWHEVTKPRQ